MDEKQDFDLTSEDVREARRMVDEASAIITIYRPNGGDMSITVGKPAKKVLVRYFHLLTGIEYTRVKESLINYGTNDYYDGNEIDGIKKIFFKNTKTRFYHTINDINLYYKKIICLSRYEFLVYTLSEDENREREMKKKFRLDYVATMREFIAQPKS